MTIIDHEKKLIFIAIPKTASSSIHDMLIKHIISDNSDVQAFTVEGVGKRSNLDIDKHSTALEVKNLLNDYSSYHSFCVVRNSYDWIASWYNYRQKSTNPNLNTKNLSFKESLQKFWNIKSAPGFKQLKWITNEKNEIIIDTIIRYENIEDDLQVMFDKLNIKINVHKLLAIINTSGNKTYQKYYDDECIDHVTEYQKEDIEKFNFKF